MLSRSYPYLLERWETDAQLTSGGNDVRNNSQFCVGVSTTYIIIRQMTSNETSPEGLSTTTRVPEGVSPCFQVWMYGNRNVAHYQGDNKGYRYHPKCGL